MSEFTPADQLQRGDGKRRAAATSRSDRKFHALPMFAVVFAVTVAVLALQNILIDNWFPHLARVSTDFSAAYLNRELRYLASSPPQTIFLGDSVLWGFRISPEDTAISLLRADGLQCSNLAFKSSSPPNYYALALLLERYGIRPKAVVIEINQKVFNEADAAYQTLHPGVEGLVTPLLTADDRAALALVPAKTGVAARFEKLAESLSLLYAMRSDIRETLYGDIDVAPVQTPRAEQYKGTYDLSPLSPKNVGVEYLDKTLQLLRSAGIPVIAFLTPTNHILLHDYIDSPEYRANVAFLSKEVTKRGAELIDLDAAFPQNEFLDESHLTVHGQVALATILRKSLSKTEGAPR